MFYIDNWRNFRQFFIQIQLVKWVLLDLFEKILIFVLTSILYSDLANDTICTWNNVMNHSIYFPFTLYILSIIR